MNNYPTTIKNLINCFKKLPGIGEKNAERLALSILNMNDEDVSLFSNSLLDMKKKIKRCSICNYYSESDICSICLDKNRDESIICVVETPKNVALFEKMGSYNGLYHVLNGLIAPLEGVGPDELNIASLEKRINNDVKEVIISTPFTPQGEMTSLYIEKVYKNKDIKISRIGYGLPAGGDIEYVDELTLKRALDSRIETKK
jgi:recombination protein RecR